VTSLSAWSPPRAAWTLPDGRLTVEAQRWLRDLYLRVGGAEAPSNADIAVTEYADSGIEESKAELFRLRDEMATAVSMLSEMRARLDSAEREINGLKQGSLL
jgi:hypothetical protein